MRRKLNEEVLLQLPSCEVKPRERLRLSPRQRRAAIRLLAEKGVEGIEELLKSAEEEEEFKRWMERRRQEYLKERRQRLKELKERMRKELERLRRERESAERKVEIIEIPPGSLMELGIEDELIAALEGRAEMERERKSLLRRLLDILLRIWYALRRAFARVIKFLFGRERGGRKREVRTPVRGLEGRFRGLSTALESRLLKDPELQREVDRRLVERWGERGRRIVKRKFRDEEEYLQASKRLLKEILQERLREREEEMKRRREEAKRLKEEKKRLMVGEEALKSRLREEKKSLEEAARSWSRERLKEELLKSFERMGYVRRGEGGYEITESLVERFSELIYSEVVGEMGGMRRVLRGGQQVNLGMYERGRLKSVLEEPHMDLLESLIQSKMNHPRVRGIYEEDMVVLREEEVSLLHVIILFDSSGSMEERGRLGAAKRAALALYRAVKRDNPNNMVDFIAFATDVERVSLRDIMARTPHGFTNMEKALRAAMGLLKDYPGERNLVYLITDGLPEAYDTESGPVAGDLKEALRRSVEAAGELARLREVHFHFFLLEPRDETYVSAAREIVSAAGGTLVITDPENLEKQVVQRYYL
ncbi:MAG: hypothetical protein DRN35_06440 [Thermoplasmata archaeon]|nr:MAG: hypothetical protein DRN35_06440 [Thermoplasmata archaeon]RLF72416.1 MAG: hypothetical protein DRN40_00220 [Thermoplasmata archaeon]